MTEGSPTLLDSIFVLVIIRGVSAEKYSGLRRKEEMLLYLEKELMEFQERMRQEQRSRQQFEQQSEPATFGKGG